MKRFNWFVLIAITALAFSCDSNVQNEVNPKTKSTTKKEAVPKPSTEKIGDSELNRTEDEDTIFYSNKRYSNLSNQYNFRLKIYEHGEFCFDANLKLEILSKSDSLLQTIKSRAESCAYPFTDNEVSHVRSFETHFNEKREQADGSYHGELIVGDFNFDSLTDIALIKGYPMSGTPSYDFFLQTEEGSFQKSRFYSNKVQFIPAQLNYSKRTFLTRSHSGCCWNYFDYYKVDSLGNCKLTYHRETGPKRE